MTANLGAFGSHTWRPLTVGLGIEFKWLGSLALPDWTVSARAGDLHSATPIPDRNFNPVVADADSHTLSMGAGVSCNGQGRFLGVIACARSAGGLLARKAIMVDVAFQTIL